MSETIQQSINQFKAHIEKHSGPAKSERFYVQFFPPTDLIQYTAGLATDLVYQCDSAELPGINLNTHDYRIIGPTRNFAAQTMFNEVSFSIYCTSDFYEKPFFEAWIEYINPRSLGWDFRYTSEYATTVEIVQMDLTGQKIIYGTRLYRAYPISIQSMPLNWQDDNIHRLNVVFKYWYYSPINTYSEIFANMLTMPPVTGSNLNMPNPMVTPPTSQ
jgi:hypothetical protein